MPKIYYVSYLDEECGRLEAFLSKAKANKRRTELKRDKSIEMLYDVYCSDFPISAEGIRQAFAEGADAVPK